MYVKVHWFMYCYTQGDTHNRPIIRPKVRYISWSVAWKRRLTRSNKHWKSSLILIKPLITHHHVRWSMLWMNGRLLDQWESGLWKWSKAALSMYAWETATWLCRLVEDYHRGEGGGLSPTLWSLIATVYWNGWASNGVCSKFCRRWYGSRALLQMGYRWCM